MQEPYVRLAIELRRARLIRQVLTESVVLALGGRLRRDARLEQSKSAIVARRADSCFPRAEETTIRLLREMESCG